MCGGCWDRHGRPQIQSPEVRAAAEAVSAVYDESCVGGNLHIVIDDWNIEDDHIDWCENDAEMTAAEQECARLFRQLSEAERRSALALHEGYWTWQPEVALTPPV